MGRFKNASVGFIFLAVLGIGKYSKATSLGINPPPDFGEVFVGSSLPKVFDLTISTNTISNMAITGDHRGDFSITQEDINICRGQTNCRITITFTPSVLGERKADLEITLGRTISLSPLPTKASAINIALIGSGVGFKLDINKIERFRGEIGNVVPVPLAPAPDQPAPPELSPPPSPTPPDVTPPELAPSPVIPVPTAEPPADGGPSTDQKPSAPPEKGEVDEQGNAISGSGKLCSLGNTIGSEGTYLFAILTLLPLVFARGRRK